METKAWDAVRRDFVDFLRTSGKAERTAYIYAANVSMFWRWCAGYETCALDVDREAIRSWLSERLKTVSSARVHNDLAALKLFFAYAVDCRYRADDPTDQLRVKRAKSLPTEPLDSADFHSLLNACLSERDRLIILVLAYTGLRVSELAELRAESIDWTRGLLKVHGKGDKERLVAPAPEIMQRLHAFVGMFPQGPIFVSRWGRPLSAHQIRKLLYDIAERAKIQHVHPHRFRATFATSFIEQHADIQALQDVLGHNSIETTARYAEYTRQRRAHQQTRDLRL